MALTRLHRALKAAALPVLLSAEGNTGWEQWRPGLLHTPAYDSEDTPKIAAEARPALLALSLKGTPWRPSAPSEGTIEALLDTTGQLRVWLQRALKPITQEPHYDGVVLDLSERPLAEGLALLTQAFRADALP